MKLGQNDSLTSLPLLLETNISCSSGCFHESTTRSPLDRHAFNPRVVIALKLGILDAQISEWLLTCRHMITRGVSLDGEILTTACTGSAGP